VAFPGVPSKGRPVSIDVLQRFADRGFSIAELLLFSDTELEAYLNAGKAEQIEKDPRQIHLESQFSYLFSELRRVGVTRQLLWQKYINEYPDGFGYSRFCEVLQEHIRKQGEGATMRFEHEPGKLLQVDFAGDMQHYADTDSGELIACPVLVAVLPFSG
jgi:transposase